MHAYTYNQNMKKLILILFVLIGMMTANAQGTSDKKYIYVVDGYFFYEMPVDYSQISNSITLSTPNGTRGFGLIINGALTEKAKSKAVPKEIIPEADHLLYIYNEMKGRIERNDNTKDDVLKVGDKFPQFKATDIDGGTWSNADVEGKVMVLNCWYTGCGPCRAEMPELSQWKNEMPDIMFFSATFEKPEMARPVLEKIGFNWIALVNDTQFSKFLGSHGYPLTVVIDKSGNIVQVEYGTSPTKRNNLKQTIMSLR